jgi:hypothetical protein
MTYAHKAVCRFTLGSWSESVLADIDGEGTTRGEVYCPHRGVTRADVTYYYTGDLEGTSSVVYLIAYKSGAAPIVAFERFEGSLGGHAGTCVFKHVGQQDTSSVSAHVEVVPGMGTGGLANLRGEAELSLSGHCDDGYELVLSYEFA